VIGGNLSENVIPHHVKRYGLTGYFMDCPVVGGENFEGLWARTWWEPEYPGYNLIVSLMPDRWYEYGHISVGISPPCPEFELIQLKPAGHTIWTQTPGLQSSGKPVGFSRMRGQFFIVLWGNSISCLFDEKIC
jgi:hypothetical protein